MASKIFRISCPRSELDLNITLQCGQSFRWRRVSPGSEKWRGVVGNVVWTLSQDDSYLICQPHFSHSQYTTPYFSQHGRKRKKDMELGIQIKPTNSEKVLDCISEEQVDEVFRNYFQLDICLEKLYKSWAEADSNFALVCPQFSGVRMLRQDPVENVFSFICSSNNNIQRITMLVDRLCKLYGSLLTTVEGTTWHSFPTVAVLAGDGVEDTLRAEGFGYRAKFIHKSAKQILERGGEKWLHSLRLLPYKECHSQLMSLHGVGAKVSDCICLMSMGHLDAIPVDTHVFQIAARDYLPHLKTRKTVTDKVYQEIGDHFRTVFGEYAGWAHSVLFSADLKIFQALRPESQNGNKKQGIKKCKHL